MVPGCSASVDAPVEAGQVLGTMVLSYEGRSTELWIWWRIPQWSGPSCCTISLRWSTFSRTPGQAHPGVALIVGAVVLLRLLVFRRSRRARARAGERTITADAAAAEVLPTGHGEQLQDQPADTVEGSSQ